MQQALWYYQWDGVTEDTSKWPEFHDVLLIRHGEYNQKAQPGALTPIGTEQAQTTGKYLDTLVQELDLKIGQIIHSPMLRADQTAKTINSKLREPKQLEMSALLREGQLTTTEVSKMNCSSIICLTVICIDL